MGDRTPEDAVRAYLDHLDELGPPLLDDGSRADADDLLGYSIDGFGDYELRQEHLRSVIDPNRAEVAVLRRLIEAAHHEQRQAWNAGRGAEAMTLEQHWSATAGWMASRIREIERVGEPDWPDAMNSAARNPDPASAEGEVG